MIFIFIHPKISGMFYYIFDVTCVCFSPEHIIPHISSPPVDHIEQSVTIIPNLRAVNTRRKSMANYAFPELHPEAQLQEPSKNLLIYTQTGVDSSGRRHSVSIPLLPPSSKTDTPKVTIQRKGSGHSQHRRNSSRNMESINVRQRIFPIKCLANNSRSPGPAASARWARRPAWTVWLFQVWQESTILNSPGGRGKCLLDKTLCPPEHLEDHLLPLPLAHMDHCEAHLIDQLNKVQYSDAFFINIGLGNFYFVQIFTSSWTVPLLTEWKSLYQNQFRMDHKIEYKFTFLASDGE